MRAGLALLAACTAANARDIEVTRACFPGFCVESRADFSTLAHDEARGRYRLRLSLTQEVIYLQTSVELPEPHCGALCERVGPEEVRNTTNRRLMGRIHGPFEACEPGAAPFYVYAYVYFSAFDLTRFAIERDCGAPKPRPSAPSRRG